MNRHYSSHHNRRRIPRKTGTHSARAAILNTIQSSANNPNTETQADAEYSAKNTFEDFRLHTLLHKNIFDKGYRTPTPIQDQAIPAILNGHDVIGIANTGTGKTAAFLIPLINKAYTDKSQKVLIITPTRELALQIYDEFRSFSANMHVYGALCIGGANIDRQRQALARNPQFIIGTPGRLKDLSNGKGLQLNQCNNVVLDEADRMVDMGFINDIQHLVSKLPQQRHSLFFSATITPKVNEILKTFVKEATTISVRKEQTTHNIQQKIVKVDASQDKIELLHTLLIQEEYEKVLVFGRTKWGVQKLANQLERRGIRTGAIHGNKNQNQRQRTLNDFRTNRIRILFATDVASRGLDIDGVSHVINYDLPESLDDYIHRIGRTGRANQKGTAVTFVD